LKKSKVTWRQRHWRFSICHT